MISNHNWKYLHPVAVAKNLGVITDSSFFSYPTFNWPANPTIASLKYIHKHNPYRLPSFHPGPSQSHFWIFTVTLLFVSLLILCVPSYSILQTVAGMILLKRKLYQATQLTFFFLLLKDFYYLFMYLYVRDKGREKEKEAERDWYEKETLIGCLSQHLDQRQNLKLRHMPWPGLEQATICFAERCTITWATPIRAQLTFYLNKIKPKSFQWLVHAT